ncbi:MAG TPA: alpha/beta fold hydrolase, partial [Gemmatimonadaceae bacterium]|nr:alpha/beta fold hydrolase [Gemmatimonadaceae bacterium]
MMLRLRFSAAVGAVVLGVGVPPTYTRAQSPTAVAPPTAAAIARAPDQYATLGDVRLRYREIGRGEAVVMLHGMARSLEDWIGLGDSLARDHRVIAVDQRGFGKSSRFSDSRRFGVELAEDVVRLLDHLDIERAHLVGHSMGARVAAAVAARHPDRVESVTLVAGPFFE